MKKICFLFIVALFSISAFAQAKKIAIFCELDFNGNVTYIKSLKKILPDSLQSVVQINPRKDDNLKTFGDALLFMGANGWKLVSVDRSFTTGILSKEIVLDKAAWELYIEKLKNLHQK